LAKYVTVSAKIDEELRKKLAELGIKPSKVIRESLEKEVEEKTKEQLCKEAEKASKIISKVRNEEWVKAIRESREER
jgi:antitoxin component of RelBE/YafQ-DinJ toxin-antitoxin module